MNCGGYDGYPLTITNYTHEFKMLFFLTLFLAFASLSNAHSSSDLYKKYRASANKTPVVAHTHSVSAISSNDQAVRDKSLFYPPLPGQTGADYHPQLKSLAENDTQIIYYSWHAHVYFFHEDANVTQRTLALRDQFMKRFSIALCDDSCFMGGPFDTCVQGKSNLTFKFPIKDSPILIL